MNQEGLKKLINDVRHEMYRTNNLLQPIPFSFNGLRLTMWVIEKSCMPNPEKFYSLYLKFLKFDDQEHVIDHITAGLNKLGVQFEDADKKSKKVYEFFETIKSPYSHDFFGSITDAVAKSLDGFKCQPLKSNAEKQQALHIMSNKDDPETHVYCYSISETGGHRTEINEQKAKILRPDLYKQTIDKLPQTCSYKFSDNPNNERSDKFIIDHARCLQNINVQ